MPFYSSDPSEFVYVKQQLPVNYQDWHFKPFEINNDLNDYNDLTLGDATKCSYFLPSEFDEYVLDSELSGRVSCLHINCRSLPLNIDSIQVLLQLMSTKFDFIVFTETWLTDINANVFANALPGYSFYHISCASSRGGGVAAYIRNIFNVVTITVDSLDSFEHMELKISHGCASNFLLSVVYRPPNASLNAFITDFSEYLDKLDSDCNKATQFLIAGDFNINLLHYNEMNAVSSFLNLLYSHSLYPTITLPTRITCHTATLIDNIYINNLHARSGLLYSNVSDHLPIFVFMNNKLALSHSHVNANAITQKISYNTLKRDISHTIWPDFANFTDADSL